MKQFSKRSLAWLSALMLMVSLFVGIVVLPAQAATVNYVYSDNYVYNWGVRDELATFLSPMAEDFYADNNVTYAQLAALSGSSTLSSVPNSALYEELHGLMYDNLTNPTSYAGTRDLYRYTDCQNSAITDDSISSFYSGDAIGPDWDSGSTWNREHVWPNSKSTSGSSYTDREEDIMMLRPTSVKENNSRSNTPYGESDGYYHPNEESGGTYDVRGDAARVVLYVYVCWGGSDSHDGALDNIWNVFESKDVLLKWIEEDPVDTWELGRNDSVEAITGTRNVFVDYPELAFLLFDEEVPADYDSPSGEGSDGGCAHNYVGRVTTAATCGTDGVKTYTCSLCGHSYTEAIAANGAHTYDNACDADCNVCGTVRTASKHVYAADCATACDVCGAERSVTSGEETTITFDADKTQRVSLSTASQVWESGDLTVTNNKTASSSNIVDYSNPIRFYKSSEIIIAYPDMTSLTINIASSYAADWETTLTNAGLTYEADGTAYTIEFATPVDSVTLTASAQIRAYSITAAGAAAVAEHTYDDDNDATCNACGAVREVAAQIFGGGLTSVSEDVNGLAFYFDAAVTGAQTENGYEYVADSASVTPYVDGESYPVVRMGAVISNGVSSVDIEAKYLWDVAEEECSFAVRLVNIPADQLDREITARPYYVYEVDGEEVVVYGDTVTKTYNQAAQ